MKYAQGLHGYTFDTNPRNKAYMDTLSTQTRAIKAGGSNGPIIGKKWENTYFSMGKKWLDPPPQKLDENAITLYFENY